MRECLTGEQLEQFLTGRLGAAAETHGAHLEACGRCQAALAALENAASTSDLAAGPHAPEAGADAANRVGLPSTLPPSSGGAAGSRPPARIDRVGAETLGQPGATDQGRPPTFPGYQVLGELGRGGMGIVYRARQVGLNRLTAVKVILPDEHTGADVFKRFEVEARASAALQHPHIVQVYEIGTWDGRPFFSMEYLAGGTLRSRLREQPQAAEAAARLVETLARAVQYAHEHGIVHRDLKPANILFTADGTPKITDFGLAKLVGGASSQTRTGEVVGTPSYMAPEQALGSRQEVGPATDVYALGALLYEQLTGQPPFTADTVLDVLYLVIHAEPVAVTLLRPQTPRDLATITAKCLEKAPARRYASALDLADDLRRFLHHQPIRARPVGPRDRLAKWVRRRPAVAALLALVALLVVVGFAAVTWQWLEAEGARQIAENEKRLADAAAAAAKQAQLEAAQSAAKEKVARQVADNEKNRANDAAERARSEADAAKQMAEFLAGLFEEMDPLAFRERTFGARDQPINRAAAIAILDRGAEKLETLLRKQPAARAALLDKVGIVYVGLGRWDRAQPLLREALDLRQEVLAKALERRQTVLDKEYADLATGYLNLGFCLVMSGKREQVPLAGELYQKALVLRRKLHGNDDPRTAEALLHLGSHRGLLGGNPAEGEKLLQAARDINLRKFGKDSREYLMSSLTLLQVHLKYGQTKKIEPLFLHIREILKNQPNGKEFEHITNLYVQGYVALLFDKSPAGYKKATKCFEEAVARGEPLLGESHFLVLEVRKQIAHFYRTEIKDYDKAEQYFKILAQRYRQLNGPGSQQEGDMLYSCGLAQRAAGRFQEAERTLLQARCIGRLGSPPEWYYRQLLDQLGQIVAHNGNPGKAAALFKEDIAARRKEGYYYGLGVALDHYVDAMLTLEKRPAAVRELRANVAVIEQLMSRPNEKPSGANYRDHARRLARLSGLIGANPESLTEEENAERRRYADQAMRFLKTAVAAGFQDVPFLQARDFDCLRSRQDFQQLLKELQQRPKKK